MKKYSFFYHFNKPVSKQRKKPTISIHYRGQCILVDNVVINTPTKGRINKRQPFFVMTGKAKNLIIKDGIAIID